MSSPSGEKRNPPKGREARRRLFFALWPDSPVRRAIADRRAAFESEPGRCVPDRNLHITLLFLGDQPAETVEPVIEVAAGVSGPGFPLVLDRLGWFARARVAWLGGRAPRSGEALVGGLEAAVRSIGIELQRRRWHPHATLFRRVDRRPRLPKVEPLEWDVTGFSLVESIPGKPYQVLRTWPLQSDP
ncbi:MAG: RNA 2',3'-cyclic phosphodiesterase [Wenzhouxiangellaceae bacterium]|nr:RNA 2',3'-cyclic phosphodiesterase [Wenzhouxiangellaceae bacterium]